MGAHFTLLESNQMPTFTFNRNTAQVEHTYVVNRKIERAFSFGAKTYFSTTIRKNARRKCTVCRRHASRSVFIVLMYFLRMLARWRKISSFLRHRGSGQECVATNSERDMAITHISQEASSFKLELTEAEFPLPPPPSSFPHPPPQSPLSRLYLHRKATTTTVIVVCVAISIIVIVDNNTVD
ncbi:hypothetical protein WN51_03745 [Melipona quadrifasciata]|uniref:Uncharacterized protein n=1 Tax=Melipona quadrifasciata TaxID=166423 RepID=A0A0N0BEB1_9HYME|nr:hypothetical protein WN51_03745 [Melipona quadrifasciata]